MKNFPGLLLAIFILQGCATSFGQSIVNPNVDEDEWQAEQAYFVEQAERFCFNRPWDEKPLSLGQNRPLHGSKTYNLWGRITDDMTGPFTSDFHYVCHLTANIPMHTTIGLNDPVYHIRRSSPWAYGNRRQAFHQRLQSRYGALDTRLSASPDHHQIPSGIAMLLRDGETQINVQYFSKNSGVRLSVYRRQLFQGNESDLANFPAGSKVVPSYEIRLANENDLQSMDSSFIKVESPATPVKLVDILAFDQISDDEISNLQSLRENLTDFDKERLQVQTKYNLYRFDREMEFRQTQSNDLKQFARESAAFERQLAERRAAANRAIFANVVSSIQSQNTPGSYAPNGSTSSETSRTTSSAFHSGLAPWGDIQAEAIRARQMKKDQFNEAQIGQKKADEAYTSTVSSRTQTSSRQTAPSGAVQHQSTLPDQQNSQTNESAFSTTNTHTPTSNRQAAPSGPVRHENTSVDHQNSRSDESGSSTASTPQKSKVYEPMPETAQSTTDTWWSSQSQALAYARFKAAGKVTEACRNKNARSDSIRFSEVEAGIAPARWNYSAPDCRQGGFMGKEWKCEAKVSGTCYRMQ